MPCPNHPNLPFVMKSSGTSHTKYTLLYVYISDLVSPREPFFNVQVSSWIRLAVRQYRYTISC